MDKKYHGKLLLTGEYFVLDGVPALAIPTRFGQRFTTNYVRSMDFIWEALDREGKDWLRVRYGYNELKNGKATYQDALHQRLYEVLVACQSLRGDENLGYFSTHAVTAAVDFNRAWGLGTSSTLIAFFAEWAGVNPYALLEKTFGGSGYDLACATATGPIRYERNGTEPKVTPVAWHPEWLGQTYFVYLNQKQNSRDGIRAYRGRPIPKATSARIGELTTALLHETSHLRSAAQILQEHETLVSEALNLQTVQEKYFPDFPGQLKSLGAWGGDFIWALSERPADEVRAYFNERSYGTVIPYNDMALLKQ